MVQGRGINSHINAKGQDQASRFFEAYKGTKFDKIYTSSLIRTQESVQGFIDMGIPFEPLVGLDEISWGSNEGLPYDELIKGEYLKGIEEWKNGNSSYKVAGGESPEEVAKRQKEAIQYIMSKEDEETILIATHGRAMRILVCWLTGRELHEAEQYEHSNLCLYQLSYDGGVAEVIKANDTNHLV